MLELGLTWTSDSRTSDFDTFFTLLYLHKFYSFTPFHARLPLGLASTWPGCSQNQSAPTEPERPRGQSEHPSHYSGLHQESSSKQLWLISSNPPLTPRRQTTDTVRLDSESIPTSRATSANSVGGSSSNCGPLPRITEEESAAVLLLLGNRMVHRPRQPKCQHTHPSTKALASPERLRQAFRACQLY